MKDVPAKQLIVARVRLNMGGGITVAKMDVQTILRKEEYAKGMGQRERGIFAAMKGVTTTLSREEYVSDMVPK